MDFLSYFVNVWKLMYSNVKIDWKWEGGVEAGRGFYGELFLHNSIQKFIIFITIELNNYTKSSIFEVYLKIKQYLLKLFSKGNWKI